MPNLSKPLYPDTEILSTQMKFNTNSYPMTSSIVLCPHNETKYSTSRSKSREIHGCLLLTKQLTINQGPDASLQGCPSRTTGALSQNSSATLPHSISGLVKQAVKLYLHHNHCDNTPQMPEFEKQISRRGFFCLDRSLFFVFMC